MQFHLALQIKPFKVQLDLKDKILIMGTCFSENIGLKLKQNKFDVLENPHGILYNPMSICKSIESYLDEKIYLETDLFFHYGLWSSWDHHGRFSSPNKEQCLKLINQSQHQAIERVKNLDWLIITSGSAFVYNINESSRLVANCHKVPNKNFEKKRLHTSEICSAFEKVIFRLKKLNPHLKILFTVSPVRYTRDGVIENNLSKAILLQSTHQTIESNEQAYYFPAYELVIDDLRDYRFFKEDMVHPTQQAIDYVWEKFESTCINDTSLGIIQEVSQIMKAKNHKPLNPDSKEHMKFRHRMLEMIQKLKEKYTFLDLKEEEAFFKGAHFGNPTD
jgi:hypothetical protein